MIDRIFRFFFTLILSSLVLSSCSPAPQTQPAHASLKILAIESFLADIAQHVSGDRAAIDTLIPAGSEPHAYQPTPQDVARIAESDVLIINGAHLEEWLDKTLENAGGQRLVIEASAGLTSRQPSPNEIIDPDHIGDPHFWLDPNHGIHYVENIRDGLSQADPAGAAVYARNAETYISQLKELDGWIQAQVSQIPEKNRQLVTNHESFGYFADRYGFTILGTIIPSTSSAASPSARQMAALIDHIRASGARAIFLETNSSPELAEQIAQETGVQVVSGLYTHATSQSAPGYIEMLKHNVTLIVQALK